MDNDYLKILLYNAIITLWEKGCSKDEISRSVGISDAEFKGLVLDIKRIIGINKGDGNGY